MTEQQVVQLPLAERKAIATKKCYNKKIKENPEFYAKEKKRVVEYMKNRYANDEEYRERLLAQKRASYHRRQELKKQQENLEK